MDLTPSPSAIIYKRRRLLIAAVSAVLLLVILATAITRHVLVNRVARSIPEKRAQVVARAFKFIEGDFSRMLDDMTGTATYLSRSPAVVGALPDQQPAIRPEERDRLIRFISTLSLPERTAVEIYDLSPAMVAWKGNSMPLDDAPNTLRFLETTQTSIALDKDVRAAVAVWQPVRKGGKVIGAVRLLRFVQLRSPVQNEYLRDYNLASYWSGKVGLPVRIEFAPFDADISISDGYTRLLQGVGGEMLGRVFVQAPSAEALIGDAGRRAEDLLAFWVLLLLLWISALVLYGFFQAIHPPASRLSRTPATVWFFVWAGVWWGVRFMLLWWEIPARWQTGKAPLAPLFDPAHLASVIGGGLMRSPGDLLITALFFACFASVFFYLMVGKRGDSGAARDEKSRFGEDGRIRWFHPLLVLLAVGLTLALAVVVRHAVLDSTLDYFSRSGLIPPRADRLILVVVAALQLVMVSLLLSIAGLLAPVVRTFSRGAHGKIGLSREVLVHLVLIGAPSFLAYMLFALHREMPWPILVVMLGVSALLAYHRTVQRGSMLPFFTVRGILLLTFLSSVLLYPVLYSGMDARRRIIMLSALESFEEGKDPKALFAIEQALAQARGVHGLSELLAEESSEPAAQDVLDSLATEIVRTTLLASLGPYDVGLAFVNAEGKPVGSYYEAEQVAGRVTLSQQDSATFDVLRAMYAEQGSTGMMVEQLTGRVERDRFQYVGIVPVGQEGSHGWVMARAEPQVLMGFAETPFPRVLLPAAFSGTLQGTVSLAEFRNGILVRSIGQDFGRYRLAEDVRRALLADHEIWRRVDQGEASYLTHYRKKAAQAGTVPLLSPSYDTVVAVRVPSLNSFDHLYYLLRLTGVGVVLGFPFYLLGLWLRRRAGMIPLYRVRFRDKVLNAFMAVGIISVGAVGIVGREFIREGEENYVQNWLRQNLERVEESLALATGADEMPYHVLDRIQIDSLAARVGLELNVYRNYELVASSRPQLVRDRLIDRRLSIEAYKALYVDGIRFFVAGEKLGSFSYKSGYRALLDESGRPRYVLAVPTLAQQERLEEEQARTLAYLFGALLLLVLVVLLTASLLANAIARPIGRLRVGLLAVARGRFQQAIPVDSRDEIGELVETFNAMQQQLAESRRALAQQERQLAWREMARQVAHEIKNPLTPMKLSVQHLRRAFVSLDEGREPEVDAARKFTGLFDRITSTLIEQIDALARIANDFHSFARMPTRVLEQLDLNEVVTEAVSLMQEDAAVEIHSTTALQPLIVEADREEVRRIFINLIKNAMEAIPPGRTGLVRVETSPERIDGQDWARTTIEDNGHGVSEDLVEKIFQPNFSTKTSGTGLGLAIARKSAEDFGGTIGFETTENEGSSFWVLLPVVPEQG